MPDVYARTLRRAVQIVGGVKELAARLSVPGEDLARWLAAEKLVPLEVFLQAVDVVVSHELEQMSREPTIESPAPRPRPEQSPSSGVAASHGVDQDEPTIELKPRTK